MAAAAAAPALPRPAAASIRTERTPPFDFSRACWDHGLSPPALCGQPAAPFAYADRGGPDDEPARLFAAGLSQGCPACRRGMTAVAATGIRLGVPAGRKLLVQAYVDVPAATGTRLCLEAAGERACAPPQRDGPVTLTLALEAPAGFALVADPAVVASAPAADCPIGACVPECGLCAGAGTALVRLFAYTLT